MLHWRYMTTPESVKPKRRRPKLGIILTARDHAIFRTLAAYRLVDTDTLHALYFPDVKHRRNVHAVLKRLADHRYVTRRFISGTGAIYSLARRGAATIHQPYSPKTAQATEIHVAHRLDKSRVRASFELALNKAPDIRLLRWFDEYDADDRGGLAIQFKIPVTDPSTSKERTISLWFDDLAVLEETATGKQEAVAIEIDRGTHPTKRWRDRILAVKSFSRDGFKPWAQDQGIRATGFRLFTFCRSYPRDADQLGRRHTLASLAHRLGGRRQFWFTTFSQIMPRNRPTGAHVLHSPIWQRSVTQELHDQVQRRLIDYVFDRDRR